MPGFGYLGAAYPGAELLEEGGTPPPPPSPPVNVTPPSIVGLAQQGQTLAVSSGTWTNEPTSFTYQWQRCNASGSSCAAITGATNPTYLQTAADVGHTIRVEETATNAGGSASATSSATAVVVVEPPPPPPEEEGAVVPASLGIRERAPTALIVSVKTPDGHVQRWAEDDPNPILSPTHMTFGSSMPGGFDRFSCVLQRNSSMDYPDLREMSTITVQGIGGAIAWQGRLEKLPDVAGFQSQITPEAVGFQARLEDDQSAREIYIDQELSRWGPPSTTRQIALIGAGYDYEAASLTPSLDNLPSLSTLITGTWEKNRLSEAWYDARGLPIGKLFFALKYGPSLNPTEVVWHWTAFLSDAPVLSPGQDGLSTGGTSTSGLLEPTAGNRVWAYIQTLHTGIGGAEGQQYGAYWTDLTVWGYHGLTPYSTPEGEGLRASSIVGHAVGKWAPGLAQVIEKSNFPVPQLAFFDPTTAAEIVKQATRFELQDWAVWEGPTFYMNKRGKGPTKRWRARVGPAQLQETGPQASRLWNGVVVQYQDMAGQQRMVGPPGFAGGVPTMEDPTLLDQDPLNPLNELKPAIRKWALLHMGTSTEGGAKQVGRTFLAEQKERTTSGQASLVGHVEDLAGMFWPSWMVRAGDEISFTDSRDVGYRRIVSVNYDHSSRTNTLQLDQPPEGMQALLERLSVVLVGLGVS